MICFAFRNAINAQAKVIYLHENNWKGKIFTCHWVIVDLGCKTVEHNIRNHCVNATKYIFTEIKKNFIYL